MSSNGNDKKTKVKEILSKNVKTGVGVTPKQLDEAASAVVNLPEINETELKSIANTVLRDPDAFTLNAYDMSAINNELEK